MGARRPSGAFRPPEVLALDFSSAGGLRADFVEELRWRLCTARFPKSVFRDENGDVHVRGRERDHDDVDVGQGLEDPPGESPGSEESRGPRRLTIACRAGSSLSPRRARSALISARCSTSSIVTEIETSDVAMRSMGVSVPLEDPRRPDAGSRYVTSILRRREGDDGDAFAAGHGAAARRARGPRSAVMTVPGQGRLARVADADGMPLSTAGRIIAGWRTLLPK